MATGMALSVAQTLFAALQCQELRWLCSMFGYESQLKELESSVTTIKAVLLDAESKHQELTNEGQIWLENLKDAVYDVDDLLDEFKTMAVQKEQMHHVHAKTSKKVRRFFSRYNKFLVAFNVSQEIKKIKGKLDSIVIVPNLGSVILMNLLKEERKLILMFVRRALLGLLLKGLDSSVDNQDNVSFVTIVGMGGLGKTALAQLVLSDDRIQKAFELKLWVCVSEEFSMGKILSKMLENKDELIMERLVREARQKIGGKRYLLVLDDVWNEDRHEWFVLRDFLAVGGRGSRVLVTSRSKQVASVTESNAMHELQGLSGADSWSLFKAMAFEQGKEEADIELVEVGKEIVKRCANVPLSIRVIGSLLYGQETSKWLSFRRIDLSKMGQGKDGIMPILMFSYYNLSQSLKVCFSYCALFPKDYVLPKEFLIRLWSALGCLKTRNDLLSIEDIGEEVFLNIISKVFLPRL